MARPIDANGTQAVLIWSQIDWRKIEKSVLRLQHRIFMAKVKGDVKGMESLQRLLASSRAAKLLALRKVGQEIADRCPIICRTESVLTLTHHLAVLSDPIVQSSQVCVLRFKRFAKLLLFLSTAVLLGGQLL